VISVVKDIDLREKAVYPIVHLNTSGSMISVSSRAQEVMSPSRVNASKSVPKTMNV
jgi:hypothetical protein